MREHAERVPLASGEHHFGVGEGRAALGRLCASDHDGPAVFDAAFFVRHETDRLLPCRHLGADERRRQVLQRESLRAVHDGRWQVLVAQSHHPVGELTAQ